MRGFVRDLPPATGEAEQHLRAAYVEAGDKREVTYLLAMAVMTGLFLVTLVRTSYCLNGLAIRTLRLEEENGQLFKFLLKTRTPAE